MEPSFNELENDTAPFVGALRVGHCASEHVGSALLHVPTPLDPA
jgi:hypothetical protein